MSRIRRVWSIISAIIMILSGIILIIIPDAGMTLIAFGLSVFLIGRGLKFITYYFSMARLMVGGKSILLIGVFLFDFGIFTLTVLNHPRLIVIIYLLAGHLFDGVVNTVKSIREKKEKAGSWKRDLAEGIIHVILAILCIAFINNIEVLVVIYSLGLFYSALTRISAALRRTAIVYIQ